jgi:hypothetical protein
MQRLPHWCGMDTILQNSCFSSSWGATAWFHLRLHDHFFVLCPGILLVALNCFCSCCMQTQSIAAKVGDLTHQMIVPVNTFPEGNPLKRHPLRGQNPVKFGAGAWEIVNEVATGVWAFAPNNFRPSIDGSLVALSCSVGT